MRRGRLLARLRDLSVGRKLLAGFGVAASLLVAVLAVDRASVVGLSASARWITDEAVPKAQAADDVRSAAGRLRATQNAYLLGAGDARPDFEAAAKDFETALGLLQRRSSSPTEVALASKITSGYQTYLSIDQLIWEALQAGNTDKAVQLALGAESLGYESLITDAEMFSSLAQREQAAAATNFRSQAARSRRAGMAIGGITLSLVLAMSVFIARAIRDPLARLEEAAQRAASGDLAGRVDVGSADETGRLAEVFNTMLDNLRRREALLAAEARRQDFDAELHRALEMADDEESVLRAVERAVIALDPGVPAELLLADSSKAHLTAAAAVGPDGVGPGCPVESPWGCIAVRNGRTMTFSSSDKIDACPKLRDRPGGPCSAVCVPVSFMGRAIGVLHATGPDKQPPAAATAEGLGTVGSQAGTRLGMIRSFERTQVQASTDGLTGLLNRRSFETRVRAMHRGGVPFALVMADLDHFKRLNDTFGHDAGDKALRVFAQTVRDCTRPDDVASRYGGEEFLIAFSGADAAAGAEAAERLRRALATNVATGGTPVFTASFGVADSGHSPALDAIVRVADAALYEAKHQGRDRIVVSGATPEGEVMPRLAVVPGGLGFDAHHDDPLE